MSIVAKGHLARKGLVEFKKDERGGIAIIFALSSVVATLVTGLAIDCGRVYQAESKIAAAADSAALATARGLRERAITSGEASGLARRMFDANMATGTSFGDVTSFDVTVDPATNGVKIDIVADIPMTFGQIAGLTKMSIPKSASAVFDSKDIELGLQLDVTGSMCMPCTKIDALKGAVSDLLDIVMPDGGTANKVRIGLAPFAAGVNAGDYAAAVSNGRAANGCVYERSNLADQATEEPPQGSQALRARSDLAAPRGYSLQNCPTDAKVVAMTDDKALLRRTVNGWTANGSTSGHLGAAWAWYLVSPKWASVWPTSAKPVAYGDKKTLKAVILMTDGIYNTVGGWSNGDYGSTATQSTKLAKDTCDAMKAKGITVYTIGFQAPTDAKTALTACASGASKFYDATDETKLREAFRQIASELNNLRLTN